MRSPTLDAGPVTLRAWRESDAQAYVAGRDEEVLRWTTESEGLSAGEVRAAFVKVREDPDLAGFAVVDDLEGDVAVGNLAVKLRGDVAEVSYWLAAAARGKGSASAALLAVCAWLEDHVGVVRIEALMHPENQASRRAALRAGFVEAGLRSSDAPFGEEGQVTVLVRDCR